MDLCISELQQEWPECFEHNAPFNFCLSSNCDFQVCTGICCLDFCPGLVKMANTLLAQNLWYL